jgi:hypothetical protein
MAESRYLLESGSPDGYLLEDGSGVLVKETLDGDMASTGSATPASVGAAIWDVVYSSTGVAAPSGTSGATAGSRGQSNKGGLVPADDAAGVALWDVVFGSAGVGTSDNWVTGVLTGSVGAASGSASVTALAVTLLAAIYASAGTSTPDGISGAVAGSVFSSDPSGLRPVDDATGAAIWDALFGSSGSASPSGVSGAIIPGVFGADGVAAALGVGRLSITGVTMDSAGSPLGSCTIHVFLTADDTEVDQFDSAAVTGVYAYYPTVSGPFYLVAYLAGSPDVAGTTVNTLVGT